MRKGLFNRFVCSSVLQQMRTEVMGAKRESEMSVTGISPVRKNLKSYTIKASSSCKGHAWIHLKSNLVVWHHSEARNPVYRPRTIQSKMATWG